VSKQESEESEEDLFAGMEPQIQRKTLVVEAERLSPPQREEVSRLAVVQVDTASPSAGGWDEDNWGDGDWGQQDDEVGL